MRERQRQSLILRATLVALFVLPLFAHALPNLTATVERIIGVRMLENTVKFLLPEPETGGLTPVTVVARIGNSGTAIPGGTESSTSFFFKKSGQADSAYEQFGAGNASARIPRLNGGGSVRTSASFTPPGAGTWVVAACPDYQEGVFSNCGTSAFTVERAPAVTPSPCSVTLLNDISFDQPDWETTVFGEVKECDPARWKNLGVGGVADLGTPWGFNAFVASGLLDVMRVLDFSLSPPGYRQEDTTPNSPDMSKRTWMNQNVIPGSSNTRAPLRGYNLEFTHGPISSGTSFRETFINFVFSNERYFKTGLLYPGVWPLLISERFYGEFSCTLGGQSTDYYPNCDTNHALYENDADNLAFCREVGADANGEARNPDPVSASVRGFDTDEPGSNPLITRACANGRAPDAGSDLSGWFYDTGCTNISADTGSARVICPNGVEGNPIITGIIPRLTGTRPAPSLALVVRSSLNNGLVPGVFIDQISITPADPFPPNYFAGLTEGSEAEYRRDLPSLLVPFPKDFTVVLRAPATRTNPSGSFSTIGGWTGCTFVSDEVPDSGDRRRCSVTFSFPRSGGETVKTVTANYRAPGPSAATPVPLLLSCSADGGRVSLYFTGGQNATSYNLLRGDVLIRTFTAAGVPTQTAPFTESGLAPGSYSYQVVATNGTQTSAPSAPIIIKASEPCPDLVVEPGSVEVFSAAPPTLFYRLDQIPANTSVKFRAKIRNKNGATAQSFDNQFQLDENPNSPYTSKAQPQLSGLGAGIDGLSPLIISSAIPSVSLGNHSLQVCADVPIETRGLVKEENLTGNAEQNNCLTTTLRVVPGEITPPPFLVRLEGRCESIGAYGTDAFVCDYGQRPQLQWYTSGNPASCKGLRFWNGASKTTQNPEVSGNPEAVSLLGFVATLFDFQIECRR